MLGRFAGQALKGGKGLLNRIATNIGPMGKGELAMTLGPDVLFGGVAAAMTPGDIGDKALAGVGSAVGGAAGGLGLRGLTGAKSGLGILGAEMVGGIGGDMAGMAGAESLMRMKGGGTTPWEKMALQQEEEMRRQILEEVLGAQRAGTVDPTLFNNGLS